MRCSRPRFAPLPPIISGVSDAFTGQIGVAPTTWTAIYGTNLSTTTRTWDGAISGTTLPTSLDEIRATINGRPATVYFVSPGQVNVLAPLDDTTGNVAVTLSTRYGTSPPLQIRKANFLPAFYAPFGESTGLRVTAVAPVGGVVPARYRSRWARPCRSVRSRRAWRACARRRRRLR